MPITHNVAFARLQRPHASIKTLERSQSLIIQFSGGPCDDLLNGLLINGIALAHNLCTDLVIRTQLLVRNRNSEVDSELLAEQARHGAAVAQVHPVAGRRILLLVLTLAPEDVVEALGAGYWRGEPDLLVGGLLVDDVGAGVGEGEGQDSGLWVGGLLSAICAVGSGRRCTYGELNLDIVARLCNLLQLVGDDLEVLVGHFVVLAVCKLMGHGLDFGVLHLWRGRIVRIGQDTLELGGRGG